MLFFLIKMKVTKNCGKKLKKLFENLFFVYTGRYFICWLVMHTKSRKFCTLTNQKLMFSFNGLNDMYSLLPRKDNSKKLHVRSSRTNVKWQNFENKSKMKSNSTVKNKLTMDLSWVEYLWPNNEILTIKLQKMFEI